MTHPAPGPRPLLAEPLPASGPALELILCGPRESFRWATHDYPHHLAKWHCHPEYELHLIRESTGRMMIGDHVGAFEPGSLILTGPNLPHNWVSAIEPGASLRERDVLVQFTGEIADTLSHAFPEFAEVGALLEEAAFGVEFTGETATLGRKKLCEIGTLDGPRRLLAFLDLMATLATGRSDRRTLSRCAPALGLHTPASRKLERVIGFLATEFRRDITLAEAADICTMEATAFSRFFKHQTGHNFSAYVNHLRVQAACQLLAATDKSVTEICFETGFNNTANFNRRFAVVCGETPSAYRAGARRIQRSSFREAEAA
ncbi:AraC family transcriptional regulator [Aureimonas sp. AU20]|uniref:AraC family transcriptional regulator n=1 Tax=Aureimonas sp. AU20 TaxID=1349819 RepID=UPI000722A712|nr:AraC family transcriptional regulator [Aureimonas sp. AU20]ALN72893.1 hypothetical protein M673_09205 [Aureimonas sp. AU20]